MRADLAPCGFEQGVKGRNRKGLEVRNMQCFGG